MKDRTDDLRIQELRPLLPPAILLEEIPASDRARHVVAEGRKAIHRVLAGEDDRLIVVVGPCSVHDPDAAREYAHRLVGEAARHERDLLVVMRTYFEKPRTVAGWKGLINDPTLDGSFRINDGLRVARRLLLDIAEIGLPPGTEFLDPIMPQWIADLVSWGAIGARTTESQTHRELASGLSMPIGFKNGTGGSIQMAVDAVRAARHPHHFLSVTKQGVAAIVSTSGNDDTHIILRGGKQGPNHHAEAVAATAALLEKDGLPGHVLVDCSHGNSGKDHLRQPGVAREVADQVRQGSHHILGVMLESFLLPGRQDLGGTLVSGLSVTDACMGWEATVDVLGDLADAARARR